MNWTELQEQILSSSVQFSSGLAQFTVQPKRLNFDPTTCFNHLETCSPPILSTCFDVFSTSGTRFEPSGRVLNLLDVPSLTLLTCFSTNNSVPDSQHLLSTFLTHFRVLATIFELYYELKHISNHLHMFHSPDDAFLSHFYENPASDQ